MKEKELLSAFEEFERLMDEERIYLDRSVSYAGICAGIGVSPKDLDEVLMEELGMTGDSIVDEYRKQSESESHICENLG